jgi:hypothetical protein
MYEGVPQPAKAKPIHYQERAVASVGYIKGITKSSGYTPKKQPRPPGWQEQVKKDFPIAVPIAPNNSESSTQGPSERHAGHHQACSMSDVRTSIAPVNTPVRETQKLSAVLYDPERVGQDN